MSNLEMLMDNLRTTKRMPTEAECELIAREGSAADVADALCYSCGLSGVLRKRFNADRRKRA